ncbi:IgG-binding virulence factor TspB family protein [Neisseria sp. HMSC070H10]|uniref:IgG-binding virulence factor TspB family protein n=1 Tax=Neisseria sp. HMSC070H10 TaxID=1715085 RepID=UPI0008A89C94|nr:IgG-binding virulence factor TspB family protein [Neisseria sp. HMSC070H10]
MMKILQRLFITVVILLGFNFSFADVDIHVEKNGRMRVPAGGFNQNGIRPWMYLDNNGPKFHHEYVSRFDKSLHVREASTGLRSASTVPVTLEARVSRKAVLSGAFGLVKAGAKLALKAAPYVGAASYAYDAYQAVNPSLESAGYEYNDVSNEYLKVYKDALCTIDKDSCVGVDTSVMRALSKGGVSEKQAQQLLLMQVESEFKKYFDNVIKPNEPDIYFKYCFWLDGVACETSKQSRYGYYFQNRALTKILEEDEFLNIATPSIDSNPTPFVEGTGRPEYKENIKVPAGTVVTIGPVTPENGKPVQITITFGQDSNGNTTANVATTQRPDLTPGGSEAPNKKPDPDPAPNPDGKPDKKPDDKPDPDGNPDKRPDDDPSDKDKDKDKRKEDKKDDKKEESKGLLCNIFPDILACSEKGDVEEQEEPFKIPHTNNDTTFSPDFFLPDNGVCPAPRTATYLGITMEFKYDMICNFAEMIRFLVIGIAAVAAAYIMFSSRKD